MNRNRAIGGNGVAAAGLSALGLACALGLGGCVSAPIGLASAAGIIGINAAAEMGNGNGGGVMRISRRGVVDGGNKWSRTFVGDAVKWTVPFGVEDGVDAVLVLVDPSCEAGAGNPDSVGVSQNSMVKTNAEVIPVAGREAVRLTETSGVGAAVVTRWLIMTPAKGGYSLSFKYGPYADAEKVLRAKPCIVGWKAVDGDSAIAATIAMGAVGKSDVKKNIPTPGANMDQRVDNSGRTPVIKRGERAIDTIATMADTIGKNESSDVYIQELGLVGDPAYDLAMLDDAAVGIERGLEDPAGDRKNALQRQRRIILRTLAEASNAKLRCELGRKYSSPRKIWDNKPTVPLDVACQ